MAAVDPRAYARVFEGTQDGKDIIEELTLRFAKAAVTKGGIDAVLQTYHNDGARSVIEHIVRRINQASGVVTRDDPE